jgi:hypothetical protein
MPQHLLSSMTTSSVVLSREKCRTLIAPRSCRVSRLAPHPCVFIAIARWGPSTESAASRTDELARDGFDELVILGGQI